MRLYIYIYMKGEKKGNTYVPIPPGKSDPAEANLPTACTQHSRRTSEPLGREMTMHGGILQELPVCLGPDWHGGSARQSSRLAPKGPKGNSPGLPFFPHLLDWQGRDRRLTELLLLPKRCCLAGDSR